MLMHRKNMFDPYNVLSDYYSSCKKKGHTDDIERCDVDRQQLEEFSMSQILTNKHMRLQKNIVTF